MSTLIEATPILAFCILIGAMFIGDIISTKTKAFLPAILVCVLLLLLGVWGKILPATIIEVPGFSGQFASYIILMFLVDMGSSVSIKQFVQQWRTVIIGVGAIAGIAMLVLTLGAALFGWEMAVAAAPPLSGGMVACIEMTNAAIAAGNQNAAAMSSMIFLLQSLPGCMLLPIFIKRQARALQKSGVTVIADTLDNQDVKRGFVHLIPAKYKTSAYYLFNLAFLATLANFTSQLLGGKIAPSVFALIYGIAAVSLGIIEKDGMKKSNSSGFLLFASLISVFASLLSISPQQIASMLAPFMGMLVLGIVGILVGGIIMGKIVKVSPNMSAAFGLNCLLGFPLNYMLTQEGIKAVAKDQDEEEALSSQIMPSILIAGFVCVTIGSVVFASIMKNFL